MGEFFSAEQRKGKRESGMRRAGEEKEVVVVGGGPGGYPAAIKASQLGARVTLVEKKELGGTCLHCGCIPTKFLLKAAKERDLLVKWTGKEIKRPLPVEYFGALVKQKNQVVSELTKGTRALLQKNNVKIVPGTGSFEKPGLLRILETGEQIRDCAFIVATGSENLWPPIEGLDLPGVLDSERILNLESLPKSLTVIGGGVIGVEFAQMFQRFGAQVTILELLPRILPYEDEDVSQLMLKLLGGFGIRIQVACRVLSIRHRDGGLAVAFESEKGAGEIVSEQVLVASGRRPFHEKLGLKEIGLDAAPGKPIPVNGRLETGVDGVFAVGDLVGGLMLAHKATAEGEVAACNAVGLRREMSYAAIPRVVYTDPEVASVGLSEKEARGKYGNGLLVGRFPFTANSRAVIEGTTRGFVKVLAEPKMQCIVGASIVGPQAGHLIGEFALAIQMEATLEDVVETVHAHPTLSEAVREAVMDARGEAIHIPPRSR